MTRIEQWIITPDHLGATGWVIPDDLEDAQVIADALRLANSRDYQRLIRESLPFIHPNPSDADLVAVLDIQEKISAYAAEMGVTGASSVAAHLSVLRVLKSIPKDSR